MKESSVREVHERVASPVPELPLPHKASISQCVSPATQKAAEPQVTMGDQAHHQSRSSAASAMPATQKSPTKELRCVSKLRVKEFCDFVTKLCVKESCGGDGDGRQDRADGSPQKNKDPTQRCAEVQHQTQVPGTSICVS